MANACNPCPCGEMDGTCDGCRAAAAYFSPVPASAVTCRHGDTAALCLLCRTSPLRVAKEKPQVNSFEFSLWLQNQDTDALAEWIKRTADAAPDAGH